LQNGLATYLVCKSLGLKSKEIETALSKFKGVSRRMDLVGDKSSVKVYDDFAHHPTSIKYTLEGLRKKVGKEKIICLLEMRSNTMLSGYHDKKIPKAVESADQVYIFSKDKNQINAMQAISKNIEACSTTQEFLRKLSSLQLKNCHLICLSNGSFDGIHQAILERI
jgi:UDP-N-acetylmuramate: L-alanyl-gamma-D-glutamyl-meso-diaminopimelate ligase